MTIALFAGFSQTAKAEVYNNYQNDPNYQARLQQILSLLNQAQQMLAQLRADYGQSGSVLGASAYNPNYNTYPTYGTTQTPEISNLSTYSGVVGSYVDINGLRMMGGYGTTNVWLENSTGQRWQLYPQSGATNTYMRVQINGSNCQYSGSYCSSQSLATGLYNIYLEVNGQRSNSVMFNVASDGSYSYNNPYTYNNCQYSYNCNNYQQPYTSTNWQVTAPTGGQVFNYADTIQIQWQNAGGNTVELRLKTTTGLDCKIDEVNSSQTSYSFRPIGSTCYGLVTQNDPGPFFVEITAKNTGINYYDPYQLNTKKQSGLFTIIVPSNI